MDFFPIESPPPDAEPRIEPEPEPTPAPGPRSGRPRLVAAAMVVAVGVAGFAGFEATRSLRSGATPASTTSAATATPATESGSGSTGSGSGSTTSTPSQIEATVDAALVDVTSTLGGAGTAEGTGMVLTADGEILTNNHVISGATSISVQIGATGATYSASVVGYDVADDVAVLKIANVTGLKTISTAPTTSVSTGDAVIAIGNALGKGGTPTAVTGSVTALHQTITASDDTGSSQETLADLIEFSAAVQPGDSGGATVNADGQVIGMTTAAESSGYRALSATTEATTTAYAIPIGTALDIAARIEEGTASSTVHIGEHGLLGVEIASGNQYGSGTGTTVAGVQSGSAAATAGITEGDTITSVSGRAISSISDLNATMAETHVGDHVTIAWQDSSGQSHEASVTLVAGAA